MTAAPFVWLWALAAVPLAVAACTRVARPLAAFEPVRAIRPDAGVARGITPPPAALAPPDDLVPVLRVHVVGKQIYTCSLDGQTPPAYEWQLRMPDADLLDDQGRKVGRHYAGPVWEWGDGSKVRGRRRAAVATTGDAVAWMAFDTRVAGRAGTLTAVTFVQQVDTKGGGRPVHACDVHAVGKQARVDFTARHVFFAPRDRATQALGQASGRPAD